jgi:hypothetical protein
MKLLQLFDPVGGADRERIRQLLEHKLVTARWMVLPGVTRDLARDLKHGELVGPGGEPAEPAEPVELGEHVHQRIVRRLLGEVIELGAGDRSELTAPA